MSDFRVAVRRTNEWDGPSMLKIYTPYVEKTHYTPDTEVPTLAEYVQRIDTYTYGRMWILTEINNQTAGFCFLTDRDIPKDDLFSADAQLYVSEKCLHSGVGTSLYSLMLDIMHHANYRRVTAHINLPNDAAVAFHKKMGFHEVSETDGVLLMERAIEPEDPNAKRFTKASIDGDYAVLRRTDNDTHDEILVARALLPEEIDIGTALHYEMFTYSIV